MPIVYEDALKRDIKENNFCPVYILFGDDSYLKKHYSDRIVKSVCGDDTDFNLQIFDENSDLQSVYDAVNQFPMMADKKCVLLLDYDFQHAEKDDYNRLCEILSDVPETTVFVLRFDGVEFDSKKGTKEKKLISAAEKCKGKIVCLNHRSEAELVQMLVRGAKKRGSTLNDKTARYLIEVSGDDINVLTNEIDKLSLFSKGGEITEKTVDFVCSKTVDASVYEYVKQIFALNVTSALKMLDDMFFMHVEPMVILYSTAGSYVDMLRIYEARKASIDNETVIEDFSYGKRAFALNRAAVNLKKFTPKKLKRSFDEILKTDKALKSFSVDARTVLEELTVKLALIIASDGEEL